MPDLWHFLGCVGSAWPVGDVILCSTPTPWDLAMDRTKMGIFTTGDFFSPLKKSGRVGKRCLQLSWILLQSFY